MWQVDSLIVSEHKYKTLNNDPSLSSPEVSTHWLVHRDLREDNN